MAAVGNLLSGRINREAVAHRAFHHAIAHPALMGHLEGNAQACECAKQTGKEIHSEPLFHRVQIANNRRCQCTRLSDTVLYRVWLQILTVLRLRHGSG